MFKVGDRVVDDSAYNLGAGTIIPMRSDTIFPGELRVRLDNGSVGIFRPEELRYESPHSDTASKDYHLGYSLGYYHTKRATAPANQNADFRAGFRAGLDQQHAEMVVSVEAQLAAD